MRNKHLRDNGEGGGRLAIITAVGVAHAESRARDANSLNHLAEVVKAQVGTIPNKLPVVAWEIIKRMSGQLEDRWNTIGVLMQQLDKQLIQNSVEKNK